MKGVEFPEFENILKASGKESYNSLTRLESELSSRSLQMQNQISQYFMQDESVMETEVPFIQLDPKAEANK